MVHPVIIHHHPLKNRIFMDFPLTIQLLGMPHEPDAWWL
jgi:hypothetical protein